ncbi:Exopolyphosphatase [Binucleata daphniae]
MSAIKTRLTEYFNNNKREIKNSEFTIVIGNQGMDLDSFVSSLIVGFAEKFVHVVNMKKEIFMSKGDLMYLLKMFDIDPNDLIYLERPLGSIEADKKIIGSFFLVDNEMVPFKDKNIKLCLTDHNEPVKELQTFETITIIDHHRLDHTVANAKIIYIDIDVGSATTLVAKYLGDDLSRKHHCKEDLNNRDPEKDTLCVSIAKLLLIPIIIDTKFLKNRTSVFDQIEYKRLKKKANIKKKELKKIRKTIKVEKLNDHTQETEVILQKDLKEYIVDNIKFGMATIKYRFEDWIEREGKDVKGIQNDKIGIILYSQLNEFRKKAKLDFFFVGCKMNKKRNFIVVNFPWIDMFSIDHQMKKVEHKGLEFYSVPIELSRKIIAPKVREFLIKMHKKK